MTLKLNGTNSEAAPAYAGDDADTGLQCGTDELKLVTGGTARATVDSSGDVMIGTTSNTAHSDADNLIVGSTGGTHQGMTINGSTSSQIRFADSGSNTAGYIIYSHSTDSLQFATNGTERVRIHGDGTLAVRNGILLDPGQLSGSSANILDEYEEGTWTPTCASDGNIGSSQYTNTYTKIGRLVTINCDIHALDNITSTNPIKIGGLPFVPSVTSGEYGSTAVHGERVGSSIVVAFLQYLANNWVIRFRKGVGSSNYSDVDHSDLNNASDNNMRFSLTYEIVA